MDNQNINNSVEYAVPPVSIMETEKDILLYAEMPGLAKENIGLEVIGEDLIITGKRAADIASEGYKVLYKERKLNDFFRKFKININVEQDKINGEYKDGVLKVTIPKSEESKPKKIMIK